MVEERELIKGRDARVRARAIRVLERPPAAGTDPAGNSRLGISELDEAAMAFVNDYCERELDPLLTPVTVDPFASFSTGDQ